MSVAGYLCRFCRQPSQAGAACPRCGDAVPGWSTQASPHDLRNVWLRVEGPGRVAVQSILARPENAEPIMSSSYATVQRW